MLLGGDSIAQPYGGVEDLPTSFYVNRKGIIVAVQMGLTSESNMEANIRKALGNESSADSQPSGDTAQATGGQ